MAAITEHGERISRVENRVDKVSEEASELRGAYAHLSTKADIESVKTDIETLKSWFIWRMLISVAVIQGIIAAAIKYLPD